MCGAPFTFQGTDYRCVNEAGHRGAHDQCHHTVACAHVHALHTAAQHAEAC